MIGAIIGDLAAWTWKHDRDAFYSNLVSKDAKLSECGLACLLFSNAIISRSDYSLRDLWVEFNRYSEQSKCNAIEVHNDWKNYFLNSEDVMPYSIKKTLCAAGIVTSGWTEQSKENAHKWINIFHGGKQEHYGIYLSEVIKRLRAGNTKREALRDIPIINEWKSDNRKEFLSVVCFALRCFERAWDFTSAIHNAMQSTENKHLAGMLVGGIAEAMYGCEYTIIKQKHGKTHFYERITIPQSIQALFADNILKIRQYKESVRIFFPKNRALTNVERHVWVNIENPYDTMVISGQLKYRMIKAYDTGWENRFGIYLDDGWFYIYRSHYLFYRFRLIDYKIVSLQKSEYSHGTIEAIDSVFDCLKNNWYIFSGESKPKNFEFCKYYHGEDEMPDAIKNTVEGKFWHGEMMFVEQHINMDRWIQSAQLLLEKLNGDKKILFSKYPREQQAIILYIEILYSKWCPYDSLEWILKY